MTDQQTALRALALDYHKTVEGKYGCPGEHCLGLKRLVQLLERAALLNAPAASDQTISALVDKIQAWREDDRDQYDSAIGLICDIEDALRALLDTPPLSRVDFEKGEVTVQITEPPAGAGTLTDKQLDALVDAFWKSPESRTLSPVGFKSMLAEFGRKVLTAAALRGAGRGET